MARPEYTDPLARWVATFASLILTRLHVILVVSMAGCILLFDARKTSSACSATWHLRNATRLSPGTASSSTTSSCPAGRAILSHWSVILQDTSHIFAAGPPVVERSRRALVRLTERSRSSSPCMPTTFCATRFGRGQKCGNEARYAAAINGSPMRNGRVRCPPRLHQNCRKPFSAKAEESNDRDASSGVPKRCANEALPVVPIHLRSRIFRNRHASSAAGHQ